MDRDKMSNPYIGPSADAPRQVSIKLAKWFQKFRIEDFFFISTNQKQDLPMAAMSVNGRRLNEQS
jgi:hypothetical protein